MEQFCFQHSIAECSTNFVTYRGGGSWSLGASTAPCGGLKCLVVRVPLWRQHYLTAPLHQRHRPYHLVPEATATYHYNPLTGVHHEGPRFPPHLRCSHGAATRRPHPTPAPVRSRYP
jgi:hypothetical protein